MNAAVTEQAASNGVRFDGRVALVTGAGRGLGREYALDLAQRGASVVVNNRTAGMAEDVVSTIVAGGGSAVADGHDVSSQEGGRGAVQQALDHFGRLDVVINNAGISEYKLFPDITPAALRAMIDVNLAGAWFVTQAAWPSMVAAGYGRVLLTTSFAGCWGMLGSAHYAMTKGAMIGLTRSVAVEGAPHGIHVNAISPTAFTRMMENGRDDSAATALREHFPASHIAPAAAWLVHEQCPANGALFDVRSGRIAEIFVAMTRGVRATEALSAEIIRDRFSEVGEPADYIDEAHLIEAGALSAAQLLGLPPHDWTNLGAPRSRGRSSTQNP